MKRWHELADQLDRNGMSRKQIAHIFGVTEAGVCKAISSARSPMKWPDWLPDHLRPDFARIADELGMPSAKRWALYWVTQ